MTTGRRTLWTFTINVPRIPTSHTLAVVVKASESGAFNGEEVDVATFTVVTDATTPMPHTESKSGGDLDVTFSAFGHLFIRAYWTIAGGVSDVPFEVVAEAPWLDVSDSAEDLKRLQQFVQDRPEVERDERLAEAERTLQARLIRYLDRVEFTPGGSSSPVHSDLIKDAIAAQVNHDMQREQLRALARGSSTGGRGGFGAEKSLREWPIVSPLAMDILAFTDEVGGSGVTPILSGLG
jgi:hypothetical protein